MRTNIKTKTCWGVSSTDMNEACSRTRFIHHYTMVLVKTLHLHTINIYIYIYICMYVCMYVCMYAYMHLCVYVYM